MRVPTLVVEDTPAARNILKLRLIQLGCDVIGEAGHPAEALSLFRTLRPKLVTLDLVMPATDGMDARALFRCIREEAPDAAIIVISSRAKATEEADFLRDGAIAYFQKPFIDSKALGEKLRQIFPGLGQKKEGKLASKLPPHP
jgi:two-component system LytT family response regulator